MHSINQFNYCNSLNKCQIVLTTYSQNAETSNTNSKHKLLIFTLNVYIKYIQIILVIFQFKWAEGSFPSSTLVHNFVLPENIYLSKYGSEFLRKSKENLGSNVNIQYRPTGQLVLASENYADKLEQTATLQREMGIKNELLTIEDIKERFPWINTNDIKLGKLFLAF